jgi:hypothetical protein
MSLSRQYIHTKTCGTCAASFSCGNTSEKMCWCNDYPPIFSVEKDQDCLCPSCLRNVTLHKTNAYVLQMKQTKGKNNTAKYLPPQAVLLPEIDYYLENGFFVFTAWHHLRRGSCCQSGCKNCPYGFMSTAK